MPAAAAVRPRRTVGAAAGLVAGTLGLAAVAVAVTVAAPSVAAPGTAAADHGRTHLYLVTLDQPGISAVRGLLPRIAATSRLLAAQQRALDALGGPVPVYRWTTALDGFALRLSPQQARDAVAAPGVVSVEQDVVRPLAATPAPATPLTRAALTAEDPRHGGAGEVIGVVDTGIAPESPLFAHLRATASPRFGGACTVGPGWSASDCNGKVVGARWYVAGFGADRVRAASSLSPRDTDGHGTEMASIAAGDARVPVDVGGERLGRVGGAAPEAAVAVYKACWSAPDPADDGCSAADLVSAIDDATSDGVDVLNLSVGGPPETDTVDRALLGAAESGVVVVAAAGNAGPGAYAAHPGPWVVTVGATTGMTPQGAVILPGGVQLRGAMLSDRGVGPRPVVLAGRVPAPGTRRSQARVCAPGSLDASRVEGAIVVCERGQVGRVDKSAAVKLADGVGMVLVNVHRGTVQADAHAVPTVHLSEAAGHRLVRFVAHHRDPRLRLRALETRPEPARVPRWSAEGSAVTGFVKPDVVAPGTGVLAAVPGDPVDGWDFVTGTSAAAAAASGLAATLLGRRGWGAPEVRSALVTTADPLPAPVLSSGGGRISARGAAHPGLVYVVRPRAYRAWLAGRRTSLNTPSVLLADGATTARRTVTNVGPRRLYFSSSVEGFRSDVRVTPAALRLGPGERGSFTVTTPGRAGNRVDDGYVVWRGATGSVTRIPVVLTR